MITLDAYLRAMGMHSLIIFAAIFCYVPMLDQLRFPLKKIILMVSYVIVLYIPIAAFICMRFGLNCNVVLFPTSVVFFFLFKYTVTTDYARTIFVFLTSTALLSFTSNFTYIFDARLHPDGSNFLYSWEAVIFHNGLNLLLVLCLYHMLKKKLSWMLQQTSILPVWALTGVIPFLFICLHFIMIPTSYALMSTQRAFLLHAAVAVISSLLLVVLYILLYWIIRSISYNTDLHQQNQLLEVQVTQFRMLKKYMEELKKIRHDYRQQMLVINGLLEKEDYEELKNYVSNYTVPLNAAYDSRCDNVAVDSITGYYARLARDNGIQTDWVLKLPKELPLPETDFCIMLGNLMENAIAGCLTLSEGKRYIHVKIDMPSPHMMVLYIENNFDGVVQKQGDVFLSTKHPGPGIGLSSVNATVRKYQGILDIHHDEKSFEINIFLHL